MKVEKTLVTIAYIILLSGWIVLGWGIYESWKFNQFIQAHPVPTIREPWWRTDAQDQKILQGHVDDFENDLEVFEGKLGTASWTYSQR